MKTILETKFTYEAYSKLLKKIFKSIEINEPFFEEPELKSFAYDIKGFYNLGTYTDKDGARTLLLAVETNKSVDKERRVQKAFVQRLIQADYYDSALVAFYNGESNDWRLSLITEKDNKSKLFSYLVGEGQTTKTVINRLGLLAAKEDITQQDLKETFSVGTLNDDFFKHYKELHEKLVKHLEDGGLVEGKYEFTADEFSKKLMGQVVFLYFLQKKQWLGGELFKEYISTKEFNELLEKARGREKQNLVKIYETNTDEYRFNREFKLNKDELNELTYQEIDELNDIINGRRKVVGDSKFIRNLYEKCKENNENFLHDYLEPLFYRALNKERGKSEYFKELGTRIVFLNGGLFDHLPGYSWDKREINVDNEFFSNDSETGILDIFDKYNFTVNEGSEEDLDYGVDPSMLGKIFESLMRDDEKKAKGTVYTPPEIVSYMCKESLIHYINENIDIDKSDIEEFIYNGDDLVMHDLKIRESSKEDLLVPESIYENVEKLDELLKNVKVAEPSVGSGAFLVGMLQEITQARMNLVECRVILDRENEYKIRYAEENTRYNIKLNAIKNSLHAVDIDSSAINIAKLRLWLSLVIEETEEHHRLPNLDFKIVCGDSLVGETKGAKVKNVKEIEKEIKEEKAKATNLKLNPEQRAKARERVKNLEKLLEGSKKEKQLRKEKEELVKLHVITHNEVTKQKIYEKIKELQNQISSDSIWDKNFGEILEDGGFDIVIGNPPYVRGSRIQNKGLIKKRFEEVYTGNADLLIYFYVLGFNLLKDRGILSYITSNKWLRAGYGEKFRKYLLENVDVLDIIDFGGLEIFEGTGVDVNILTGRKSKELTEWNYTDGSKWE